MINSDPALNCMKLEDKLPGDSDTIYTETTYQWTVFKDDEMNTLLNKACFIGDPVCFFPKIFVMLHILYKV